nr:Crp/Fnr family transcriptional regulator [Hyphomonas sp. Mor2]
MLRTVSPEAQDKLKRLSDATWAEIERRGEFLQAEAGDIILDLEQTDNHLLIVLSGNVTLLYPSDGEFAPTAIYRDRGKVLHHAGMHLQTGNPFQIAALEDATRVVLLERKTVYELIGQDVSFAEFLFRDLSIRFLVALEFLREERESPLILRLGKRLLSIAQNESKVELTQAEIAEIMAVTRISVSKCLKSLESLGLIKRDQRALITVNMEALEAWVAEQEA